MKETGAHPTSSGIVLSDSGFEAAFTSDLNQDCLWNRGSFNDSVYTTELCKKRAVRPSAGIKQGEFRYFETRRLDEAFYLNNIGHGVV